MSGSVDAAGEARHDRDTRLGERRPEFARRGQPGGRRVACPDHADPSTAEGARVAPDEQGRGRVGIGCEDDGEPGVAADEDAHTRRPAGIDLGLRICIGGRRHRRCELMRRERPDDHGVEPAAASEAGERLGRFVVGQQRPQPGRTHVRQPGEGGDAPLGLGPHRRGHQATSCNASIPTRARSTSAFAT